MTAGGLRCGSVGCSRGAVRFDDRRLCSAGSGTRLAARDLTLAIATLIWARLPCARYDRLTPFLFLILIGRLAILDAWSFRASHPCTIDDHGQFCCFGSRRISRWQSSRPCSANARPQTARRWATRRRPESREPLRPVAARQKPQATAGRRRELRIEATRQSPLYLDLPTVVVDLGLPRLPRRERPPGPRGRRPGRRGTGTGRGRRRADVVKYWTGYCAGPGWSPARPRRCSRTWRIARYGRSSRRTTVLGLVLSLRPSAIRVLNGLSVITGSGDVMKVTMHFHN